MPFNFGADYEKTLEQIRTTPRAQLSYPLDAASKKVLGDEVKTLSKDFNRVQSITLKSGDTTFDVRNSDRMNVAASAAVSITTITNGYNGQILNLLFADSNVTLTDDSSGNSNTISLGGTNYTSAAGETITLLFDGTSWYLSTIGLLSASTGLIGGWTVTSGYIYSLQSGTPTSSPSDGLVLASGNEAVIVYENTEKRVEVGYLSAGVYGLRVYDDDGSTVIFEASDTQKIISGLPISSIPNNSSTDISLLDLSHDLVFSVTDADTIAWAAGTITFSNGRTFSISSGNTGNMVALTYIYLDPNVSTTVLQTTTTAATAAGANKRIIGTAQNQTTTASFIPFGPGQPLIDGDNIGALSIVAGNIAASTITAGKMNVSQLSAISADLGTVTAGTVQSALIKTDASGNARIELRDVDQGVEPNSLVFVDSSNSVYGKLSGDGVDDITLAADGSVTVNSGGASSLQMNSAQSVIAGKVGQALATTATDGFLYIPTSAGTPTGTPTSQTGHVPIEYDTTNDVFYIYNSGWQNLPPAVDIQDFTSNGTWTKPAGAIAVQVICVGSGGGGGGGVVAGATRGGAGGGGGGSVVIGSFDASDLGATETISVHTGGSGGAVGANGSNGGAASFGSWLSAYGGGGGNAATSGIANGGGGGGTAGNASGSTGGAPSAGGADGIAGQGAGGIFNAEWGGGGGGRGDNEQTGGSGGSSIFGAPGGGGGGSVTFDTTATAGGPGGDVQSYSVGGGASGGAAGSTSGGSAGVGSAGATNASNQKGYAGTGGGGGGAAWGGGTAGFGGAGGAPGAGGGGGGSTSTGGTAGTGGAGAAGLVRVITYF